MLDTAQPMRIFVTGASGYIGGRLVPRLLKSGQRVRCLVRDPRKVEARPWASDPNVEIIKGDVGDTETLIASMKGCQAAYYLVHSMVAAKSKVRELDRRLAKGFAAAAERASLDRIIYLGGLGETGKGLDETCSSRLDVEHELTAGTVPVTVLRAPMIIGSGSTSFEILRNLVKRLPIMVTPKWVSSEVQPIAVRDVLHYLMSCLKTPETVGRTLDIGGPDIVTYRELMRLTARALLLRRRTIIPIPVLMSRLSSLCIHLVTPVNRRIACLLTRGLRNRLVCRNNDAERLMPQELLTARESIALALGQTVRNEVETAWTDAGMIPGEPDWFTGTTYMDMRTAFVRASPATLFGTVSKVGGVRGWFAIDSLWKLRGAIDRLLGGPGITRGRRHPDTVAYGDVLDFWRVAGVEPGKRLALRGEMKVPGDALLEFLMDPDSDSPEHSHLTQIALFKPRGSLGRLYWYSVLPFHGLVFRGMIRAIRRRAEESGRRAAAGREELTAAQPD